MKELTLRLTSNAAKPDMSAGCCSNRNAINSRGKWIYLKLSRTVGASYFPVEYKRGKPKVQNWDRIQLCAQALCIEEMCTTTVTEGALWYWEVRKRERVIIDERLRSETIKVVAAAHALKASTQTPPPVAERKRCRGCSLVELCNPDTFRKDASKAYTEQLYAT